MQSHKLLYVLYISASLQDNDGKIVYGFVANVLS